MKNKLYMATVGILLIASLTGCGDENKTTTVATGTDALILEDTSEEGNASENIYEEIVYGDSVVTIDATIIKPKEYESCKCIELERNYIEDSDIETLANIIFDEGSYFLYMPYNREQIAAMQDKLTELMQFSTDEEEQKAFEIELEELEKTLSNITEEIEIGDAYRFYNVWGDDENGEQVCNIFGTIDGENYLLGFRKLGSQHCFVKLTPWRDKYYEYYDMGDESFEIRLYGNTCAYTEEEARDLALQYVKELGFGDYVIVDSYNAMRGAVFDEEQAIDGYNVYLGREYENYKMPFSYENYSEYGNMYTFDEWGNATADGFSEYVKVYVDSDGVCTFDIYNPMKHMEVISENTIMLEFDKIHEIALEEMEMILETWGTRVNININDIELGYDYIEQDGKIVLLPVWYYYYRDDNTSTNYRRMTFVEINAIDGSIVYSQISGLE